MVFQYRKRGGQVLAASTDPNNFTDDVYFGVLTNPPTPNGTDLSVPKIWDGTQVRNATAPEIATFASAAAIDQNLIERDQAVAWFTANPVQRKILRGMMAVMVDEINILRQNPTAVLSARTQTQGETAVLNKIASGAVD
jgi:hypothetical protein